MAPLKNIVWVGTGKVGLPTLHALLAKNLFSIKLLVRNNPSTYASLPNGLSSIHQVDYSDRSSLIPHLRGQDAVIVFSSFAPGNKFDKKHITLIDAAIDAGVKYFIPSEWALDTAGIMGSTSERYGPTLPTNYVLAPKRVSHNYTLCRAAEGEIKFAIIYPGVLPEVCFHNALFNFNFTTHTAILPDNGINPFPATSLVSLATALTTLFTYPHLISNRFYHISDGVLTQAQILQIIKAESGIKWKSGSYSIAEKREEAAERMREGVYGLKEYVGTLATPFFGGLQVFTHTDNEVLGLKGEAIAEVIKWVVRGKLGQ
ncbi:hypothetical protein N0V90_001729 [Kalmusia sp. IMI 367209]|nr:hypothetical protein N0V90_001729 [Kalmusia sp. IMI 367209]